MKNILIIGVISFVSGCTIGVPRLVECDTGDQAIEQCADIVDIRDIEKGGDLEVMYLKQQGDFRECKERHEKLIEMIKTCNASIKEHNKKMDEIIKENALLFSKDIL